MSRTDDRPPGSTVSLVAAVGWVAFTLGVIVGMVLTMLVAVLADDDHCEPHEVQVDSGRCVHMDDMWQDPLTDTIHWYEHDEH